MDENMESLSEIRRLTPDVVDMMGELLHNAKTPAIVKVRITGWRAGWRCWKRGSDTERRGRFCSSAFAEQAEPPLVPKIAI